MRIAIVGSRDFRDLVAVHDFVATLPLGTTVVSGGARGVDTAAERAATCLGYTLDVWQADWRREGRAAGIRRNERMLRTVDRVVAFWDGESPGTKHAIQFARGLGLPVEVRGGQ